MRLLTAFLSLLLALGPSALAQSLYADPIARAPGDVLTVVLAERTTALRQSDYDDLAQSAYSGSATTGGTIAGSFSLDANYTSNASAANRTAQSDLLQGTLTVLVTGTDEAGNLQVEGERQLNVNGVGHRLRVAGLVRPRDIRSGNVIYSYQIANADVVYRQDGLRHRFFSPGTLVKIGAAALLVAAVVFGANQVASAEAPTLELPAE
ncbi:MAG: flagellar basal body L-ring protein FlgH [Rhodothermaceae bacterium]|nr:flagellar basal body L-ring protein FlgH [Rhodothermaceae bacterium]